MMSVVVLTKNFNYWGERSLEDAIRLYFRGKVEILKHDENKVICSGTPKHGDKLTMHSPLVVRLLNFVGYKNKKDKFEYSDQAVFDRDLNICQYWHTDKNGNRFKYRCANNELSIDHVIPKDSGGTKSFLNSVCACKYCNNVLKRNRTPEEAGMELIRTPKEPKVRKGDMALRTFSFNPSSKAHAAFNELLGVSFSHEVN
jgi:5-methylcytosine-specific restriction endonuclease McrA